MAKIFRAGSLLLVVLLILGWVWLANSGVASAHAEVLKATPGIGATVQEAPGTVSVETAENMNPDPAKTNLVIYGPSGKLVSQGNAQVNLNNPKKMSVPIKKDGEGTYIVEWKTVSADDGDEAEGAFTFKVAQEQNNFPLLAMTVTGIVALALGFVAGNALGSRRAAIGHNEIVKDTPESV